MRTDRMTCACQRGFLSNRVLEVINTYKQRAKTTQWNGLLLLECCQLPQNRPPFVFSNMNRTKKQRERYMFQSELLNCTRAIWRHTCMVLTVLRNDLFLRAEAITQIRHSRSLYFYLPKFSYVYESLKWELKHCFGRHYHAIQPVHFYQQLFKHQWKGCCIKIHQ